jgi:uncharacterized protein
VRGAPARRGTYETVVDFEHEADSGWVSSKGPEGTFHDSRVVKAIDSCVVTTRGQPGVEADLDVLRTIYRENGSNLGVGALVTRTGAIGVGDPVIVIDE